MGVFGREEHGGSALLPDFFCFYPLKYTLNYGVLIDAINLKVITSAYLDLHTASASADLYTQVHMGTHTHPHPHPHAYSATYKEHTPKRLDTGC